MRRCLDLALMGRYTAAPNPLVGCVIVHNDQIIAEGFHHHAGGPHAEVAAINQVKDFEVLKTSQLYVSLEPCSHFGRTPPCSDLIIRSEIPEVFVATRDYNAEVNGKGIAKLKNAGIKVHEGILEQEAQELNRRFFTYHRDKRPYITLKWAESADGIMDPDRSENQKGVQWISHPESQSFSHRLRAENTAILVGRKTVEIDDPGLDCRAFKGKNPLRVIIDPEGRLSGDHKVFRDSFYRRFTLKPKNECDRPLSHERPILEDILHQLYEEDVQSVLVEGGQKTLQSFIDSLLWDEAWTIKSENKLGTGLKAPLIHKEPGEILSLGKDSLIHYRNT